jgi:hypothetical protein
MVEFLHIIYKKKYLAITIILDIVYCQMSFKHIISKSDSAGSVTKR